MGATANLGLGRSQDIHPVLGKRGEDSTYHFPQGKNYGLDCRHDEVGVGTGVRGNRSPPPLQFPTIELVERTLE